jgi:UDP-2,3-diacylglucosamine hydrolase
VVERLFVSDLHLSRQRPEVTERFFRFLRQRACDCSAVYILGDLFDAWIGDDVMDDLGRETAEALRTLADQGTDILLQHGNRDFLLGTTFLHQSGAKLLDETHTLTLEQRPCLLMHGDLLCSDDQDYQHMRQMLRNPDTIADFLAKPLDQRIAMAEALRHRSGEATSLKAQDIMDVNADTVETFMRNHQAEILIHGHTHRPGVHELGGEKQRIVLGEWHADGAIYLSVINHRFDLCTYS